MTLGKMPSLSENSATNSAFTFARSLERSRMPLEVVHACLLLGRTFVFTLLVLAFALRDPEQTCNLSDPGRGACASALVNSTDTYWSRSFAFCPNPPRHSRRSVSDGVIQLRVPLAGCIAIFGRVERPTEPVAQIRLQLSRHVVDLAGSRQSCVTLLLSLRRLGCT